MVLGRLRILGGSELDAYGDEDAWPRTFPELLAACRRTWGADKLAMQQKAHGRWSRYSHEETFARSQELAAGLVALGVAPGDRVALILENSIDWACSYYAIVTMGAIAVPLYYELKPSEIEEMLRHSGAARAIVSGKLAPKFQQALSRLQTVIAAGDAARAGERNGAPDAAAPATMTLEELASRATPESRARLAATIVQPDDVASIVFTSGTTGGMKGVTLTHRNFLANARSVIRSIPFGARDRLVMVLPLHHAFPFIVTLAVAPAVGGEVTFENDLRRIRDRMAEIKPTIFIGVPALFEVMYRNVLQRIEMEGRLELFERGLRICETTKQTTGINIGRIVFRELHKRLGGSLRFMVSGGAALNPQIGRNFAALGVPVLQGWGLTEAAPVLAVQRWNPRKFYMSNYYEEHFGAVGQAVDGVEVGLIDVPEKELYVHLHGEGELVARGDNITPGYWDADDATKVAKVDEWLRTGDVGRIDDEGNVWITGRSKYVIVLDSGEKVHPDEIEEQLARSKIIEDVVVVPRKARGKTQVWAIVYPNRDALSELLGSDGLDEQAVRTAVERDAAARQADIAAYKRATHIMLTDVPLPKTLPLRKVARGQIGEAYGFDVEGWARSWAELMAAASTEPAGVETEEPVATA